MAGPSVKTVLGADPAAGAECLVTVPAGATWRLISFSVQNVQGGASTPLPSLVLDDGANIFFQSPGCTAAQAISTTQRYTWLVGQGLVSGAVGTSPNVLSQAPLPKDNLLMAGYRVRTVTAGIDANANFGVPVLLVAEVG
jgi:hypothetical protein